MDYLKTNEILLHEYLRQKSVEISDSFNGKTLIYLDMNYWIKLRNGKNEINSRDIDLFRLVSQLYKSGKCVFPVSELTFWETMKQTDLKSRAETVALIDILSNGICIHNQEERLITEVEVWMNNLTSEQKENACQYVWSKINVVTVYKFLLQIESPSRLRSFVDFISELTLAMVLRDKPFNFTYKDDIEKLNREIKNHSDENKTFQDMFLSEIGGYIAEHASAINEVMNYKYYRETGRFVSADEFQKTEKKLDNVIYHSFRLGKIATQLPVFEILPSLFAWSRWIQKDFKDGNDTTDFLHAAAALPYCDYFFTDRRLKAGISELKFDTKYNCKTEYKHEIIIKELEALA